MNGDVRHAARSTQVAASMAMPVSLGAGADATRRGARQAAQAGCVDAMRRLISSLHAAQRRVLADALVAGVDIAALLHEHCEQPTAESQKQVSSRAYATKPTILNRRLEYCFHVNKRLSWFGGTVLRDAGGFWADVLFDDGEEVCVKLLPSAEGTAWRWPQSPKHQPKRGRRDQQTVDTKIGQIKRCDQVWVKWVDGDGEFYAANVTNVSSINGITVHYPENGDWAACTETLPVSDVTPERVAFDLVSHGAAQGRASSSNSLQADLDDDRTVGISAKGPSHKRRREEAVLGSVQTAAAPAPVLDTGESKESDSKRRRHDTVKTKSSQFVGVSWFKRQRKWTACIDHKNERYFLGYFNNEIEAALASDAAARHLYGGDVHILRELNFPSQSEVKKANAARAKRLAEAKKAMSVVKKSKFLGVSWAKTRRKWTACIGYHDASGRISKWLGDFDDERDAARAFDTFARRLRGSMAHGGRKAYNWYRLNAPTDKEVTNAKARGMPAHLNLQLLRP
jgi:hypothetical protein